MITEDDIQGHWVRDWIKAPDFEDHTTRVHWMQVGSEYADVRIPLERPDLAGASALSDLPADALHALTMAEGFSGHVTLRGTHCTWHREINWHGPPDALDVGDISFDADGRIIETGVHADYTELWNRRTGHNTKSLRFHGEGYTGLLAMRGPVAVLGIGRQDKPSTKPMIEALAAGHIPAGVDTLFDGVHALGHQSGNVVIADLATQPFAEGKAVVTMNDEHLLWQRIAFDGTSVQLEMHFDTDAAQYASP